MLVKGILLFALIAFVNGAPTTASEDEMPAVLAETPVTEEKPVNFAKVPRLQSSKIPTKQEIQQSNAKFNFKKEQHQAQNDENLVPDPVVSTIDGKQPKSEDEMVFQWRALKLNKNGHKAKVPVVTNDQEVETESPDKSEASEELDDAVVPGGKDLVVYNTLASVRGADRRAQGAADNSGDGGDLQQKKGPFFRGWRQRNHNHNPHKKLHMMKD